MRGGVLSAREPCVSRLLFGTLTMGPLQRNLPIERGAELLCHAAEQGVIWADTAEYYQTYPYIKKALALHPEIRVVTKSYAHDRDTAKRSLELAQEGMGRERIDVFLLHEQESEHTLRGHREAFDFFRQRKESGVIGAVGISTHYVKGVRAAAKWPGMDIIFALLNIQGLGIADGTREQMESALRDAAGSGIGILGMKALGGGHLIASREEALRYMLDLPFLDAIAIGMQSEAEIDVNVALFSGKAPPAEALHACANAPRRLYVESWCTGCGRCVKRCGNHALSIVEGRVEVDGARCVRCAYCAGVCPDFCLKVI